MLPIDLEGKVAVVTGSTQGIGFGIAQVMARAGCNIAGCGLSDVRSTKATRFVNQIKKEGRNTIYKKTNVKSEADINLFVEAVLEEYGKIDFLISNAGVNMFTAPESCQSSFWDENIDLKP